MKYLFFRALFWASWLVFPTIAALFMLEMSWWSFLALLLAALFIWGRFVERYLINVREIGEGKIKIAVISDLHLGAYKGREFLRRIVDLVNKGKPDMVLIPGDFVFAIRHQNLREIFSELEKLKAPAYGVLGNHDLKPTGEFSKKEIYEALEGRVQMIDNQMVKANGVTLVGIGSLMAGDDQYELAEKTEGELIVMAHNPDCAHKFKNKNVKLMICGHTHGGQVRLWPIYKALIPCRHKFDRGWHEVEGMKIFVSSGLGEVDLPLRFLVRPEIVFLNV